MKKLLALAALAIAASPAMAVEKPYIAADAQMNTYSFDKIGGVAGQNAEFEVGALRVRAGSMMTRYLGLEAHLIAGAGDDSQEIIKGNPNTNVDLEIDYGYSVMGVARLPMGRAGLYAFAGYGYVSTELNYAVTGTSQSDEVDGLSYGAGVDFPFFWGLNLEADYTMVNDDDNFSLEAVSVGLRKYL